MNALELNKVCKQYPNFALQDLTLHLPKGCILGLVGENGAGKSTTIKLILDMLRADSGEIRLFGAAPCAAARADIGVVLDEVGLPECLYAGQIGRVMRDVYPNWDEAVYASLLARLELPTDKPFRSFSRGMKMKMGIAVALSHHPKLLLLDEATSGLDPIVRDAVLDLFSEFTRDAEHAVLLSSHIVSDLEKICDYIAFLHQGKLLLFSEKDRLFETYGLLHGSRELPDSLPKGALVAKRETPYGAEALVRRAALDGTQAVSPVDLEQLFLFMVKGENVQ